MLDDTKAGIEKEIKETRHAINDHLDKLEKELLTKLQEAGDSAKVQLMELVDRVHQ
jgi:TRAP-type C4-dicarboxylate transport system substrate-binding protein